MRITAHNNGGDWRSFLQGGALTLLTTNFSIGAADEAKAEFPDVKVCGRLVESDASLDPGNDYEHGVSVIDSVDAFVDRQYEYYLAHPAVDYWLGPNETSCGNGSGLDPEVQRKLAWFSSWEIERMTQMEALGKKCVIGNFSTGQPDIPASDPMVLWRSFLPAMQYAHDHGHWLGLHEYSSPWLWWFYGGYQKSCCPDYPCGGDDTGFLTFRYRKLYRQLLAQNGIDDLPLMLTEYGLDRAGEGCPGMPSGAWKTLVSWWNTQDGYRDPILYWLGPERNAEKYYARQLQWADGLMRQDDYLKGAALFTLGTGGSVTWDNFDVNGTIIPWEMMSYGISNPEDDFPFLPYSKEIMMALSPSTKPYVAQATVNLTVRDSLGNATGAIVLANDYVWVYKEYQMIGGWSERSIIVPLGDTSGLNVWGERLVKV